MADNISENLQNSDDSLDQDDLSASIPEEIAEVLKELPPQEAQKFASLFVSMRRSVTSYESPIMRQVNSGHIDKALDIAQAEINNAAKEIDNAATEARSAEGTKRWAIGSLLVLVAMILLYSGYTKDKELSEKIMNIGTGFLAGLSVGLVSKKKD
jgi:hypothetical protein